MLVDRKGQILQFHGQTGKYLNMPTAEPSLNLLDIAKEGLSLKLRSALHPAVERRQDRCAGRVPITRERGRPRSPASPSCPIARPRRRGAAAGGDLRGCPRPAVIERRTGSGGESEALVRQLEDELRATQQDLQSTIEELQASNEELRVANEEVISTNEELQSTNEELETSKEELQSVNEELTTVNSQLQERSSGWTRPTATWPTC